MVRWICAALVAASFLPGSVSASNEEEALAALRAAISVAEKNADARYAFTLAYTELDTAEPKTYAVRFDPRLPAGARWTPVDPLREALGKDQEKRLKALQKNDDADDALIYDGLGDVLGGASLVSETPEKAVFRASLPEDGETPKAVREALEMTLTLDRAGGYIESVSIRALKPFKPAPVAKVEAMEQTQRYAPFAPGGVVLLRAADSNVSGEAMFKDFKSHSRTEYRDFEEVDAPPREKRKP